MNTTFEKTKKRVHFAHQTLLNATNPIETHLIGAGGTGSQMLTALARINYALNELGHAGLRVTLWDDDIISQANLGRQLFAFCELGLYKSTALISRVNRFFGTDWNAQIRKFDKECLSQHSEAMRGGLYISCVDTAKARFEMADILTALKRPHHYHNSPLYWLDFGNGQTTGQVILSTIGEHPQPQSEDFITISDLPFVTETFGELLSHSEATQDIPSCSLADALHKQDLFINATLSQMGASLLWGLFKNGLTDKRGFFLNLHDFRSQPLLV